MTEHKAPQGFTALRRFRCYCLLCPVVTIAVTNVRQKKRRGAQSLAASLYDVAPGDDRFIWLWARIAETVVTPEMILVENWFEELKERVPN